MARNSTFIDAPPDAVWATLCDPYAYPEWVVGSDRTLKADAAWPAPGARFKVRLVGGAVDHTTSCEVDAGHRLVLLAGSSYVGPARVTIELSASGDGTELTMVEDPAGKLALLRFVPAVQLLIKVRNVRSLRLLRELAERRAALAVA